MRFNAMASLIVSLGLGAVFVDAAAHGNETLPSGPNLAMARTAFGQTGDPAKVSRTVRIGMADTMRFDPARLTIKQGETVRFVIRNHGKVIHELVLGTAAALAEHAEVMKRHPGMEHEEPYMAHVSPGKTGEIVWLFTQPGEFKYGCLVPGHFEAVMVGTIRVVAK